jgi:hypothetical protein
MCIPLQPPSCDRCCSVKSRRDGLIIAQHAVLGSEECVDQSRKGRLKSWQHRVCHQKFSEFLCRVNAFVMLGLSANRSYRLLLLGNAERKGPISLLPGKPS